MPHSIILLLLSGFILNAKATKMSICRVYESLYLCDCSTDWRLLEAEMRRGKGLAGCSSWLLWRLASHFEIAFLALRDGPHYGRKLLNVGRPRPLERDFPIQVIAVLLHKRRSFCSAWKGLDEVGYDCKQRSVGVRFFFLVRCYHHLA